MALGEVLHTAAKFKLGQNERHDVLAEMLIGLAREPAPELHAMMLGGKRRAARARYRATGSMTAARA